MTEGGDNSIETSSLSGLFQIRGTTVEKIVSVTVDGGNCQHSGVLADPLRKSDYENP